ncbi:MAG: NAD-dependent epimerase/dehydratase family protein [Opitutaceae bacterium]|nr:NAD-dependent epimerase/dehydratase family protein [Opitutaceae bacterium]
MSTYLVTGAAGFIASKVCEFLLAEDHTVVGVDNLNDYYDVRLKDYRLSRLLGIKDWQPGNDPKVSVYAKAETGSLKLEGSESNSGLRSQASGFTYGTFTFRFLDIENLPALDALFAEFKFDAVFNLAARAGVRYSLVNPHVYMTTNAMGTLNLLECQRKHGVKKHVLASTSSLYAGCPMPFTEDQPVNTPLSPYAASKKSAEVMAYTYHKQFGLDVTVLRYFTVYGPAGRPDMAPFRFVKWIAEGTPLTVYGDGQQTRDFTYVDDIARGTILAGQLRGEKSSEIGDGRSEIGEKSSEMRDSRSEIGENPGRNSSISNPNFKLRTPNSEFRSSGFEIINLGGGNRPITLNAMIALMEEFLGKKAVIDRQPPQAVDMQDTSADLTKARGLMGWRAQVSPDDGFRLIAEWYFANKHWVQLLDI